jgi:hypothetical protein
MAEHLKMRLEPGETEVYLPEIDGYINVREGGLITPFSDPRCGSRIGESPLRRRQVKSVSNVSYGRLRLNVSPTIACPRKQRIGYGVKAQGRVPGCFIVL